MRDNDNVDPYWTKSGRIALGKLVLLDCAHAKMHGALERDLDRPRVMPTETLTCQELVELVTDYLEGDLRPAERVRFETHIAQCEHCRTYLDQMRTTIRLLGKLTSESLSPAVQQELLARFRDWKRQRASP